MVATAILEQVGQADPERTLRALAMVDSGGYRVTVSEVGSDVVKATVGKRIGKGFGGQPVFQPYLVTLTGTATSCTCPDATYRGKVCKHQTLVALHVIRNPQEEPSEVEHKPNQRLAKVREGFYSGQ